MTHTDLLQLRRKVRRASDIRPAAAILFAEICDFHELPAGCKVSNEGFAERLGCTARSVRNWLRELKQHGLISETTEGGDRFLEPRLPSWITLEEEKADRKNDSTAENSFHDGSDFRKNDSTEGGKFFPTQRDNMPAEAGESAPAHEGEESADVPHHLTDDPPCTEDRAVEIGEMIGVPEKLCREWWLYYDSKGWPFEVANVSSALRKWKMNDKKFNPGSDGYSPNSSSSGDGEVTRTTPELVNP